MLIDASNVGLALLPPTGPHRVGTEAVHLVDEARSDPWEATRSRELMVQVWYPAAPVAGEPAVPGRYLPQVVAALVLAGWAEEGEEFAPELTDALADVPTHAYEAAPPVQGDLRPLVLLSPGLGEYRMGLTCLAEELASHGFVVACVDHPSDAAAVQLPDGRVIAHQEPDFGPEEGGADGAGGAVDEEGGIGAGSASGEADTGSPDSPGGADSADAADLTDLKDRYLATRIDDLRFTLDVLLAPGSGWRALIDPGRIGVGGHSLGASAAAEFACLDRRSAAVALVDGSLYGDVLTTGLDVPVLLCGLTPPDPDDPHVLAGWERLWPLLRGPRRWTTVPGAGHMSATDFDVLAGPLGLREPGHPDDLAAFGTLSPGRGLAAVRTALAAFFTEHLIDRAP
ncbi:hypothetical protein AAHZ94_08400 [Streptomyces sp. HSW2009]|uniref:alpha/beta hydrolase family protein n=1 Tax=Streptomyces sp. HSW2009 TaxID=3142890 RepID=UPI0032ED8FC1